MELDVLLRLEAHLLTAQLLSSEASSHQSSHLDIVSQRDSVVKKFLQGLRYESAKGLTNAQVGTLTLFSDLTSGLVGIRMLHWLDRCKHVQRMPIACAGYS